MDELSDRLKGYKYPNITFVVIGVILAVLLMRSNYLTDIIQSLGALGYLGVFIVGIFFVSTFTVVPASAIMFVFAQTYDPILVSIIGALGGVVADYFGYIFIRDRIFVELKPILKNAHLYKKIKLVDSKYFGWAAPLIGAFIIASPLPDEPGLALLSTKKINAKLFFVIVFLLNALGIYVITQL